MVMCVSRHHVRNARAHTHHACEFLIHVHAHFFSFQFLPRHGPISYFHSHMTRCAYNQVERMGMCSSSQVELARHQTLIDAV